MRAHLLFLALAAACGSSHARGIDAAVDGAGSDASPDAYAGPCGFYFYEFTALYLDWDSTMDAYCPIAGARWYVHADPRYVTTNDKGELAICLASNNPELDVQATTAPSTCTNPPSMYAIPGLALATRAVLDEGGEFIVRSLDMARVGPFYASFGSSFDPTRGNLFVHVQNQYRVVSISSPHDTTQAFDGTMWAAGASGENVYFPNIDLSAGTLTDVAVEGGAVGTGAVPLVAGQITYMTVVAN
jgi:hypothetical protein